MKNDRGEMVEHPCSDCGNPTEMRQKSLDAGGPSREKGEPVCKSCLSRRNVMVRQLDQMPASLNRSDPVRLGGRIPRSR